MMRHETLARCSMTLRGTSRQQKHLPETKRSMLMLYYIDKNWYHFIKICFSKSCLPSWATRQIFWKLYLLTGTLWLPKTSVRSVRLHQCLCMMFKSAKFKIFQITSIYMHQIFLTFFNRCCNTYKIHVQCICFYISFSFFYAIAKCDIWYH